MSHDAARLTGKTAWIICLSPDVCNTPVGSSVVPIPYMIASKLEWGKQTVSNVRLGGEQAFTMASRTDQVVGNEPGTAGGVASGVNKGWCRPQTNKSSCFVAGRELLQNDNVYEMNCSGPDGAGNTLGKLLFIDEV